MVAASRQLFGNPTTQATTLPLQHPIITSIVWSIGIIAVFATIAVRPYRQLSR
jgi:ABC-2 type transport system permease protein